MLQGSKNTVPVALFSFASYLVNDTIWAAEVTWRRMEEKMVVNYEWEMVGNVASSLVSSHNPVGGTWENYEDISLYS
jgi:hypothetical protein